MSYITIHSGETIAEQSLIYDIRFGSNGDKKLLFHGNFKIYIEKEEIEFIEINSEFEEFILNKIRGATVDYLKYNTKGYLKMKISSTPEIIFFIDPKEQINFGENWQYSSKRTNLIY